MAISYSPRIITNGLIHVLDTSLPAGQNKIGGSSLWTNVNMTTGNTAGLPTYKSNAIADGSGSSCVTVSRDATLETGSITFILWLNLTNIPINVGSNNNWRGLLCTANSGTSGSPLTMVLEQGLVINFSTTHTDSYRRFLNGNFAPISVSATGWQMIAYTYNQATGQAACYRNDSLILSGPMTTDSAGASPTTAGRAMSYANYAGSGFRIYGGTTFTANPNGNGIVPGELGNVMVYNRALNTTEIQQNYNALRGRYFL